MEFSSLSKQRHIMQTDDYWMPKHSPTGLTAKRSSESGIMSAIRHNESTGDNSFDRFKTSNMHFHNPKPIRLDQTQSLSFSKDPKDIKVGANSPYNQAVTFQQHCSGSIAPYGPLQGRGTQKTKMDKLREICGGSAMSGNYDMMI